VLKFSCCRGGVAHHAGRLITPGATLSEERYCADAGASAADVEIMLDHGKHLHVDDSYLWCCTPRTPEAYNRLLLSTLHADS
jgi:hypothetical protein